MVLLIALVALVPAEGRAEKRVALVIGNSEYRHTTRLKNPTNDATDMSAALTKLGFDVVQGIDLDQAALRERVRLFAEKLPGAEVALFFYAGHGLQVFGKNYLAPIDARIQSEADLDFATVDLDLVLRNMERETRVNIVFLDACRDNPLAVNLARKMGTRSTAVSRGLARVETGVGTLIAFATQPGNVALDGDGRNSPFTGALLSSIDRPGLSLGDLMIGVRKSVMTVTEGKQVPWENSSLTGQFYFNASAPVAAAPEAAKPRASAAATPAAIEATFWESINTSKNPLLYEAYLRRYPNGAFADLAKIRLDELKVAALQPVAPKPEDQALVSDPGPLREVRERLYELNYDPGPLDGPLSDAARQAIREYEAANRLALTGVPTQGLLRRLREVGNLKPWGAIVYARGSEKWGIAWGQASRKEAVTSARASCGDGAKCATEISFYGTECGAFAHSGSAWAIVARDEIKGARSAAIADCGKRAKSCRIIASVCADGAERFTAAN
jgi:uncharacterized caspase-like protein